MDIAKYNTTIISSLNTYITHYFEHIEQLSAYDKTSGTSLVRQGVQTTLRILSILHLVKMPEEQLNTYLEKAYMLYIEYTEQVLMKEMGVLYSPSSFVFNVLIGNIALNAYKDEDKLIHREPNSTPFITKLSKWLDLLLCWNHKTVTDANRLHILQCFGVPYLTVFTTDNTFDTYRIFEQMLEYLNVDNIESSSTRISMFFTAFYSHFSNNDKKYTHDDVQNISFVKFIQHREKTIDLLTNATTLVDMNNVMHWIFSE
jgi:hypothetical protein